MRTEASTAGVLVLCLAGCSSFEDATPIGAPAADAASSAPDAAVEDGGTATVGCPAGGERFDDPFDPRASVVGAWSSTETGGGAMAIENGALKIAIGKGAAGAPETKTRLYYQAISTASRSCVSFRMIIRKPATLDGATYGMDGRTKLAYFAAGLPSEDLYYGLTLDRRGLVAYWTGDTAKGVDAPIRPAKMDLRVVIDVDYVTGKSRIVVDDIEKVFENSFDPVRGKAMPGFSLGALQAGDAPEIDISYDDVAIAVYP